MDFFKGKNFTIVDVETTGLSPSHEQIIEIGLLRVEKNQVVDTFSSLINPGRTVSSFILNLTGINQQELDQAPYFGDVMRDLLPYFEESIFVAHNARFDYGFFKEEFKRQEVQFAMPYACSLRLFRHLFPRLPQHNLDSMIRHFELECQSRHRAFDDAKVIWDFFQKIGTVFSNDVLDKAFKVAMRESTFPHHISQKQVKELPESPGVYLFRDEKDEIIYIGKSVNIKDRIHSHFSSDIRNGTDAKLKKLTYSIDHIETTGELSALLLESELVKKHQPLLNKQLRYKQKVLIGSMVMDENKYYRIESKLIDRIDPDDLGTIVGVFKNKKQMTEVLLQRAKEYRLCPKLLGLEKGHGSCFAYHLDQCDGACIGKESAAKYNLKFLEAIKDIKLKQWYFDSPILLIEPGEVAMNGFVIDKWCLVGTAKVDGDNEWQFEKCESHFDLDVYKILVRYVLSPTVSYHIKSLQKTKQGWEMKE